MKEIDLTQRDINRSEKRINALMNSLILFKEFLERSDIEYRAAPDADDKLDQLASSWDHNERKIEKLKIIQKELKQLQLLFQEYKGIK